MKIIVLNPFNFFPILFVNGYIRYMLLSANFFAFSIHTVINFFAIYIHCDQNYNFHRCIQLLFSYQLTLNNDITNVIIWEKLFIETGIYTLITIYNTNKQLYKSISAKKWVHEALESNPIIVCDFCDHMVMQSNWQYFSSQFHQAARRSDAL